MTTLSIPRPLSTPKSLIACACAVLALSSLSTSAQHYLLAPGATVTTTALPDAPSTVFEIIDPQTANKTAGSISGLVLDVAGSLVPNAEVKLIEKGRPAPRITTSDSAGRFTFTAVEPGTYNVIISSPGLETFESSAVILKPGERLEMPDIGMPIATNTTTVNVVMTQAQVADEELKLETQQRVLGIFPNYYTSFQWNAAPLNARQKFSLSFHTVTDPVALIGTAVTAGIETAKDTFPDWGQDAPSYGKRFAAAYGDQLFGRMLGSAFYPIIFRQDPRYFYMGPASSIPKRIKHALLAGVEARGDNGKWQPNFSHVLGNASAGALSSVYHPASNSAQSLALDNALIGIIGGSVQGLVREFVTSRITHKVPSYAKGKPAETPPTNPAAEPAFTPVPKPPPPANPAPPTP